MGHMFIFTKNKKKYWKKNSEKGTKKKLKDTLRPEKKNQEILKLYLPSNIRRIWQTTTFSVSFAMT